MLTDLNQGHDTMFQLGFSLFRQHPRSMDAAAFASTKAPDGYRWDFVSFNNLPVTIGNEPVVALVEA